jgi:hypothetical protein
LGLRAIVGHWRGRPWQLRREQPLLQLSPPRRVDAAAAVETLDPPDDDADAGEGDLAELDGEDEDDVVEIRMSHADAAAAWAEFVVDSVEANYCQRVKISKSSFAPPD